LQFVSFGFERLEGLVSPVKKSVDLSWDAAGHGSIATTQNETDAVLLDLLPALGNLCCDGALAVNQQHENELLTTFTEVKRLIKYPGRTVSWSQAFAVHGTVTAVVQVRGSHNFVFRLKRRVGRLTSTWPN
jgi:hypothetical protein